MDKKLHVTSIATMLLLLVFLTTPSVAHAETWDRMPGLIGIMVLISFGFLLVLWLTNRFIQKGTSGIQSFWLKIAIRNALSFVAVVIIVLATREPASRPSPVFIGLVAFAVMIATVLEILTYPMRHRRDE